jgi:hypothetical protein
MFREGSLTACTLAKILERSDVKVCIDPPAPTTLNRAGKKEEKRKLVLGAGQNSMLTCLSWLPNVR